MLKRVKYSGLCIGGPKDRKLAVSEGSTMKVALLGPVSPRPVDVPYTETVCLTFEYRFVSFHRYDDAGNEELRGFWIPADTNGDHILFVLDALAKSYAEGGDA